MSGRDVTFGRDDSDKQDGRFRSWLRKVTDNPFTRARRRRDRQQSFIPQTGEGRAQHIPRWAARNSGVHNDTRRRPRSPTKMKFVSGQERRRQQDAIDVEKMRRRRGR